MSESTSGHDPLAGGSSGSEPPSDDAAGTRWRAWDRPASPAGDAPQRRYDAPGGTLEERLSAWRRSSWSARGSAGAPRPSWSQPQEDEWLPEVPASLELAYTPADLGLSPTAYEQSFPYEKRDRRATMVKARRYGRELIETVILAVLIFFAVRAVVQNFRVEGASMEPSLDNSEYLLVNKAIYFRVDMDRVHRFLPFIPGDGDDDRHLFRAPRRGDVIVFQFHLDPSRDFIKRVIAVPGDTVEVREGTVFINGAPVEEDYILSKPDYTYGPKIVPEGHYFVLGDNRRNSFDSHAWSQQCPANQQCDFVPEENIIGQAWLRYWPFDALGLVNNESVKPSAP